MSWVAGQTNRYTCSQCYKSLGQSLQLPLCCLFYTHRRKDSSEQVLSLCVYLDLCSAGEQCRSGFTASNKALSWSWKRFLRSQVCYLGLGTTSSLSCHFGSGHGDSWFPSDCKMACSHRLHKGGWRNRWWSSLSKATQEVSRRSKSGGDIPMSHNSDSSPEFTVWQDFTKEQHI